MSERRTIEIAAFPSALYDLTRNWSERSGNAKELAVDLNETVCQNCHGTGTAGYLGATCSACKGTGWADKAGAK